MSDTTSRGRFVWFDLITPSPDDAMRFYSSVIGWGTAQWEGPAPYTMWTNNSVPLGGVMKDANGNAHWLGYISSPDVDATVKQAANFGARVMVQPSDIPGVGRYAVLTDPQGALFAVFTGASQTPGHEGPADIGEFSWHELVTRDHPAALRFYEMLFGWTKAKSMDMGEIGTYQLFERNGLEMGGMFDKPAAMPGPPAWVFYVRVGDLERALAAVKSGGGQVLNGPAEVPGGDTIVNCMDPQGALFSLHQKGS
jgi:predicted enzyme related to lactoylglutathione lyase